MPGEAGLIGYQDDETESCDLNHPSGSVVLCQTTRLVSTFDPCQGGSPQSCCCQALHDLFTAKLREAARGPRCHPATQAASDLLKAWPMFKGSNVPGCQLADFLAVILRARIRH